MKESRLSEFFDAARDFYVTSVTYLRAKLQLKNDVYSHAPGIFMLHQSHISGLNYNLRMMYTLMLLGIFMLHQSHISGLNYNLRIMYTHMLLGIFMLHQSHISGLNYNLRMMYTHMLQGLTQQTNSPASFSLWNFLSNVFLSFCHPIHHCIIFGWNSPLISAQISHLALKRGWIKPGHQSADSQKDRNSFSNLSLK